MAMFTLWLDASGPNPVVTAAGHGGQLSEAERINLDLCISNKQVAGVLKQRWYSNLAEPERCFSLLAMHNVLCGCGAGMRQ